ncbi:unnamed protein product, partial [Prorocentrum cordatum]
GSGIMSGDGPSGGCPPGAQLPQLWLAGSPAMAPAGPRRGAAAAAAWALVGCAAPAEGGLQVGPRARCGASGGRRLSSFGPGTQLSGLEYLASGYDVFFGNPRPTDGAVDTGFRNKVFKANPGSEALPDGTRIPPGMNALRCDGSCSLASKVQSITSMEEYYEFLSTNVSLTVSFGDVASFAASADFQRVRENLQSHESVYTAVTAQCCAYKAFIHAFVPPPADENFLAAVDAAPEHYDQDFYFNLIGEFGTHFLSSVQMGGMYGEETEFTRDKYNDMKATKSDWFVNAQASFVVSIKAGAASETDWNSKDFFDKYVTNTRKYTLGSAPQTWDVDNWLTDTIHKPVPTAMRLKPLSELFTTRVIPNEANVTKLRSKRENMERALQEYCPEKLLRQGKIDSCAAIVSDPDAAGAERTCLAKIWGGGGPNGQPFDDSVMIQLHGLFANLEIRQIKYRSSQWMDSIQVTLSLGNNNWPLPEHGGKGGVSGTLTFSEGQKIHAVEVRYERYIDKISFWTNDGREQVIGGPGGRYSKMVNFKEAVMNATGTLPRSAWLVGLYGSAQQYVDALGFYVAYTCAPSEAPGPDGLF